jgi:hypothetical protein
MSLVLLFAVAMALLAAGPVSTFGSRPGTEFKVGYTFGLLSADGTRLDGIWAGTPCIFR